MGQGTWPRSGPKAGAAEGEAGGRKGEKQEPGREKEKGPDAEAQAWGEGGMAEKGGGHMTCFPGTRFHLPGSASPTVSGSLDSTCGAHLENRDSANNIPSA